MTNKLKRNLYILSLLLIIILGFYVIKLFKIYRFCSIIFSIILPLVFGFIFAWIINPLYKKMNKRFNKRMSIFMLIVLFAGFYGIIIWKFIPLIYLNIGNLTNSIADIIGHISEYSFLEGLEKYKNIDIGVVIDSCSNVLEYLCIFLLSHVFGFYILYTYENIRDSIGALVPKRYFDIYLEYIEKVSKNMRLYLKGTLLDTLILFVVSSVVYFFLGLKYPIILAAFSSITNIIPFVGPYIGGVPAVIMGISNSLRLGVITGVCILIIQTIESNVINPMIMSQCVKVNPILILIILSIMGKFFGLLGMIFAVPTLILIKLTIPFIKKYKSAFKLKKLNT